jgi:hypothetical protein
VVLVVLVCECMCACVGLERQACVGGRRWVGGGAGVGVVQGWGWCRGGGGAGVGVVACSVGRACVGSSYTAEESHSSQWQGIGRDQQLCSWEERAAAQPSTPAARPAWHTYLIIGSCGLGGGYVYLDWHTLQLYARRSCAALVFITCEMNGACWVHACGGCSGGSGPCMHARWLTA